MILGVRFSVARRSEILGNWMLFDIQSRNQGDFYTRITNTVGRLVEIKRKEPRFSLRRPGLRSLFPLSPHTRLAWTIFSLVDGEFSHGGGSGDRDGEYM